VNFRGNTTVNDVTGKLHKYLSKIVKWAGNSKPEGSEIRKLPFVPYVFKQVDKQSLLYGYECNVA
jgi:hypothetical protein